MNEKSIICPRSCTGREPYNPDHDIIRDIRDSYDWEEGDTIYYGDYEAKYKDHWRRYEEELKYFNSKKWKFNTNSSEMEAFEYVKEASEIRTFSGEKRRGTFSFTKKDDSDDSMSDANEDTTRLNDIEKALEAIKLRQARRNSEKKAKTRNNNVVIREADTGSIREANAISEAEAIVDASNIILNYYVSSKTIVNDVKKINDQQTPEDNNANTDAQGDSSTTSYFKKWFKCISINTFRRAMKSPF